MAIEAKYGFAIPADHRRMGAQGFLDVKRSKKTATPPKRGGRGNDYITLSSFHE